MDILRWAAVDPNSDTSWPHSRKHIDEPFFDMVDDERHAIVAGNAARPYGLV